MNNFEKLNLLVVPVQVSEYNGERVKYPNYSKFYKPGMEPRRICWQADHAENWVSWEERDSFYPGVENWFALGGLVTRGKYFMDGMEIGYGVIDVDNHDDKEKFDKTVAFLSSIGWDDTLIVQTPSGGRHYYFWCLADYLPNHSNGCEEYAIEFKTKGGWLVPNGKDRVIISDKPVKRLSLTKDSPLAKLVSIKRETKFPQRRPTNDDFDIESVEVPDVAPGNRHATFLSTAMSLYHKGCPPEKIIEWGEKFFEKNGRREQRNEISNAVRDAIKYIDSNPSDLELLLEEAKKPKAPDPLAGAEELTGWDAVFAKSVFADREETKKYIKEELKNVPKEDLPFVREMLDPNKIRTAWASAPYETQVKYEMFKDSLKNLLQK